MVSRTRVDFSFFCEYTKKSANLGDRFRKKKNHVKNDLFFQISKKVSDVNQIHIYTMFQIKIQLVMKQWTYLIKQKCIDAGENVITYFCTVAEAKRILLSFCEKLFYWQWKDSSHEFPSWMAVKTSCITPPPLPFSTPPKNGYLKKRKKRFYARKNDCFQFSSRISTFHAEITKIIP